MPTATCSLALTLKPRPPCAPNLLFDVSPARVGSLLVILALTLVIPAPPTMYGARLLPDIGNQYLMCAPPPICVYFTSNVGSAGGPLRTRSRSSEFRLF